MRTARLQLYSRSIEKPVSTPRPTRFPSVIFDIPNAAPKSIPDGLANRLVSDLVLSSPATHRAKVRLRTEFDHVGKPGSSNQLSVLAAEQDRIASQLDRVLQQQKIACRPLIEAIGEVCDTANDLHLLRTRTAEVLPPVIAEKVDRVSDPLWQFIAEQVAADKQAQVEALFNKIGRQSDRSDEETDDRAIQVLNWAPHLLARTGQPALHFWFRGVRAQANREMIKQTDPARTEHDRFAVQPKLDEQSPFPDFAGYQPDHYGLEDPVEPSPRAARVDQVVQEQRPRVSTDHFAGGSKRPTPPEGSEPADRPTKQSNAPVSSATEIDFDLAAWLEAVSQGRVANHLAHKIVVDAEARQRAEAYLSRQQMVALRDAAKRHSLYLQQLQAMRGLEH